MKNKTKQFLSQLAGFLSVRDDLDSVAAKVLPNDLAAAYDPVGKGTKPMQDETILPIYEDPQSVSIGDNLDALLETAKHAIKPLLDEFGKAMVKKMKESDGEDSQYPKYKSAPLKSKTRAEEKIRNEYDGNTLRLVDLVRASIIVDSEHQLATLLSTLLNKDDGEDAFPHIQVVRFKNRFQSPTFSGYRDALFNLRVIDDNTGQSMIVELQVHLAQVMVHKPMSHYYYGYFRQFFFGNMDVVEERMDLLTSLGDQVKKFRLNVNLEARDTDKLPLDVEAILGPLCKEGSTTEIDPSLLEESEDDPQVGGLIDELLPLWELQDVLNHNAFARAYHQIDRYQDVPVQNASTTLDGRSELTVSDVFEIAETILPDFRAFAELLVKELPTYHADKQDPVAVREAVEKGESIDIMNPFELQEVSVKPKEFIQALADAKDGGDVSQVGSVVYGSMTVSDDTALVSLFEYMNLLSKNGDVEIVGFQNGLSSKPKEDLLTTFIGYRQAIYHLLMKTESGASMLAEFHVDLAVDTKFKNQALHYLELLAPFLSGEEVVVDERKQLLDSFENLVKTSQGREYAGLMESTIEAFGENGDIISLRTFETLLGPTMLYDVKVAILCCRERLWTVSRKMAESQSDELMEEVVDAKIALGEFLYEYYRYADDIDGFEPVEQLQNVRKELLSYYGDDKHPQYLRASMAYFGAWFEMSDDDSPEVEANLSGFKALLGDITEVLGSDDSMTLRCKQMYALACSNSDSEGAFELLKQAYSEGVRSLGESHPVTLNIGVDLCIEGDMVEARPVNFITFRESVYKGCMAVFGWTLNVMDMGLSYANALATANKEKYSAEKRQQMKEESIQLEALLSAGAPAESLDFAFDGRWYKNTPWSELPVKVKKAASALNWEVDETSDSWYPVESRKWEDLSDDELKSARTLGFNRHSWKDLFSGYLYLKEDWASLSSETKASCEILGWSEDKWGASSLVEAESRQWRELSSDEKMAAGDLNFELRSWNLLFAADMLEDDDEDGNY